MDKNRQTAKHQAKKLSAYQHVFSTPEGKLVLDDMVRAHHIMSTTFSATKDELLFKEGERNVVLRILHILKMDTASILERIKDHA